ncbi:hypothetical protein ACQKIC_02035 [Peribacillus sp. NPDC046944]|uniref:hypothetical protein n=1 Tax=unclassified Peribacillus TaxID=2675266 RepID=UPI003D0735ED
MVTNKKTAIERSLDLASMILLIIIFVYIWFKWSALPDSIPINSIHLVWFPNGETRKAY